MRHARPRTRADRWRVLTALAVAALLAAWPGPSRAASGPEILVLHSYHPGYAWTDGIQKGLAESLALLAPGAELRVEYMDAKRQPPEKSTPVLLELYRLKYRNHRPAVVLASDDNALNFLLDHREELFPGAQVVVCGVGELTDQRLRGQRGYTGVAEYTDISGTIDAALRLMPGLRTIAAVADGTETGEATMRLFRQAMQGYQGRLEVVEIAGLRLAETAATLSTLSPDTAVLYLGLLRDPDGKILTVAESLAFIRQNTPQPVFTVWDFVVGQGAVGGVVVSGARQGQAMARMAAQILSGARAEDIPFQRISPSAGMYDYEALERHGLSPADLPVDALVINRPQGFVERHKAWLLLAGGVLSGLTLALIVLVVNIERRRRAERERSESRRRFQDFVETMSVGVLELDPLGRIVFANAASHAICGLAPGSLLGTSMLDLAETSFAKSLMQDILRQTRSGPTPPGSVIARLRKQPEGLAEVKVDWLCLRGENGDCTGFLAAVTDLTDLRLAQREREEGQRFATALLDASPTPIYAKNRQGRIVRVNRALELFLGRSSAELMGRHISEVVALPAPALSEKWDAELYAQGGLQSIETQLTTAAGRQREVAITRSLFLGADGQPAGIVGSIVDVTERTRMEKALRESREKYRVLFETLPVGVAVVWRDSTLLEVNRALEEQFGKPREAMLGLKPWQLGLNQHTADGIPLQEGQFQGQRAMLEKRVIRDEEVLMHPEDGRTLWVAITAAPLAGPETGAVVTLVDVTERKRMEAELKSRLKAVTSPPGEQRALSFSDLFDLGDIQDVQDAFAKATGVASLITTPEGRSITGPSNFCGPCREGVCAKNGDEGCCMMHEAGAQAGMLAAAAPILVGERVLALWHIYQAREPGSDLDTLATALASAGRSEETVRGCLGTVPTMSRERFAEIHASLTMLARQMSDLALKNLQQARDIEERQRTQLALEQAKNAAEIANQVKSDFLANVSHEIRTPLHGVLGMLQLMLVTPLNEEQVEYVDKAMYSARSLLSVINDILDFSKIESGKQELMSEDFSPAALVRASAAVFEDAARAKGLDLKVELAPDLPEQLRGDPGKIRQILFNLVGNAVKFTDAGFIRVAASARRQPGGRAVLFLDVEDSGVGIPEDRQGDVFEPFTQGDAVFTKRFQGTGLGLSIVRRLVGLMGGAVTMESESGRGTSFALALRLELPGAKPAAAPEPPRPAPVNLPPLSLLLAEDNLVSQLAAKSFLQRAGHSVTTAVTGLEVLEKLAAQRFDAVLMDIQMPEMDGVEATRRIRAHTGKDWDPDIPIIALTAYAQASEHKAFLEAGMDAAISKPLEMQDILLALERCLARRKS